MAKYCMLLKLTLIFMTKNTKLVSRWLFDFKRAVCLTQQEEYQNDNAWVLGLNPTGAADFGQKHLHVTYLRLFFFCIMQVYAFVSFIAVIVYFNVYSTLKHKILQTIISGFL